MKEVLGGKHFEDPDKLDQYLILIEGIFQCISEGSCSRLVAIRLQVVGGVNVEWAGHLQTPLICNPTFTPRVILGGEAVPAVGPVALMIADGCHVRHLGD
ncbi:MAG: hypothetical protein FRX49_09650 [Trebouxia sp. A1-2]|nr:MAG: hypothetical protein FRX49_09650 [Trebouxia sp. A1-2]